MAKNDAQSQHHRMTQLPIPKVIVSMAIPTTMTQLITVIYNSADTFFVGRINNSASAAVGAAFSLMALIQALAFGLVTGASSLISRRLGAKDHEAANRYFSSVAACELIIGLLIQIFGLLFLEPLMKLLGATETMLPYSCAYARFILIGTPFNCMTFCLNASLRSEGHATYSMIGMCSGGILNIILDPIFIFALDLQTAGAALATAVSQFFSFCILLIPFLRRQTILRFRFRSISRKFRDYADIVRTGLPTICRQGVSSLASAMMNNAVVAMTLAPAAKDAAMSAITVANKLYMLVRNIILGIGQGFQPVAGYNYGAGQRSRVKKAFGFVCLLGTVFGTAAALLLGIFADSAIGLLRPDPDVVAYGAPALIYLCCCLPMLAYSTYVNQMYQCLGFSLWATVLACCHQGIFYIPLILTLPHTMGYTGIALTQPLADIITFIVSVPFQIVFFRKMLANADDPLPV